MPLPVQALDHATGWLMAAAAVAGVRDRLRGGSGSIARLSLARTAAELLPADPAPQSPTATRSPATPASRRRGATADLLAPPIAVDGVDVRFDSGPVALGSAPPDWPH